MGSYGVGPAGLHVKFKMYPRATEFNSSEVQRAYLLERRLMTQSKLRADTTNSCPPPSGVVV